MEAHHIAMQARLGGIDTSRHKDSTRGFYHTGSAYYAESALSRVDYDDAITVGFYHEDGGTTGEFSILFGHFAHIHARPNTWMKLQAFSDSFNALVNMPELMVALAQYDYHEAPTPTPEQVITLLLSLGYLDKTQRTAR